MLLLQERFVMLFRNRVQLLIRCSFGALMQKPEIPRSHPMASSNKWSCRLLQTTSAINKAAEPSSAQRGIMNVITERLGAIMTIGINRPQSRNAVNPQTASELLEAFRSFDEDPSLKAAVFYGVGGNFCAGFDLKEFAKNATRNQTMLPFEVDATKHPSPMGPARMQLSKPVIAAVSGYAVAGGLELTLLADLRVVEQSAIFGVFCRRFGVPLIDGGTVRLPKLIGLSRALDLILTGRSVGAQEALEFGLANRVVPDGQALKCAIELAEQISAFPQECMRADRVSAYHSAFDAASFSEAMQFEFDNATPVLAEAARGAMKFSLGAGRGGAKL